MSPVSRNFYMCKKKGKDQAPRSKVQHQGVEWPNAKSEIQKAHVVYLHKYARWARLSPLGGASATTWHCKPSACHCRPGPPPLYAFIMHSALALSPRPLSFRSLRRAEGQLQWCHIPVTPTLFLPRDVFSPSHVGATIRRQHANPRACNPALQPPSRAELFSSHGRRLVSSREGIPQEGGALLKPRGPAAPQARPAPPPRTACA